MRSTLSSGTRVQYTQPPNGSLNGMPSSSTSVRLCPLGPLGKPARSNDYGEIAGIGRVDREAPVRSCDDAPLGTRAAAHDDGGAGDHVAGRIVNDARD